MSDIRMIRSILKEYGLRWMTDRMLYSAKLKLLRIFPIVEKLFERKTSFPTRLNLFEINVQSIRKILESLNGKEKEQLIGTADRILEGVIPGFSSIDLNYGMPMDWQLNPVTGERCSEKQKWYLIPDFDKRRGDIKVVWEASRFSWMITITRAYILTKDEKYYLFFSDVIKNWLSENPYGYGANYKCGQECALRMVNTLLVYSVFREDGLTKDVDDVHVKDLVDRCYRRILGNFFYAYRCIKNNHTISELMGMIVGAWCCADDKQMTNAYELLNEVVDEQFTCDGGYCQHSFNYERLAIQDLNCILSISKKTGMDLSKRNKRKIRNAALLMYQCQDDSGDMPNYGANDGALVFPLTNCGYRDFRPTINASFALLTGNQLYDDGAHQEELIWFSGNKNNQNYKRIHINRTSKSFSGTGLYTVRKNTSWGMMICNRYRTRPGHMDQLHFDLWVDGVNVLCDGGTYSYVSDEGRQLVLNESHNTVTVPGKTQMSTHGAFMIYDWPKRGRIKNTSNMMHGEYCAKNGYFHRRTVAITDKGYRIIDAVGKKCEIRFHTPCDVEKTEAGYELSWKGRTICRIISCRDSRVEASIRSVYYLKREKISCVVIDGIKGKTVTEIEVL